MLFLLKKVIEIAFKSKKEKIAFKIGFLRGKKYSKPEKKPDGDLVSIGSRKNIRVDKSWYSGFLKKYPYGEKVVERLSDYKNDKCIGAYSKDQKFLEAWAKADKERYEAERHRGSFDANEFFEAALKRSYPNMKFEKKGW